MGEYGKIEECDKDVRKQNDGGEKQIENIDRKARGEGDEEEREESGRAFNRLQHSRR